MCLFIINKASGWDWVVAGCVRLEVDYFGVFSATIGDVKTGCSDGLVTTSRWGVNGSRLIEMLSN
jgi:hypothetical protein